MPKKITKAKEGKEKDISLGQYQHTKDKRANNPQVGLVSSELDSKPKKKIYQHDPYIDPTLSWAGKVEGTSFDIDTVSLHIHERIDPKRIIKQVLKKTEEVVKPQPSLFEQPSENFSTEKEFDFYSHTKNWSNRLIAGDSLLVMNSLLEKENMAGKVQMIYIDPPYGIKYNSNFQPFTNKRDVKDKDDDSIPAEPEMIKAFRDTWELEIHSYLTHLRDRILIAKQLLHESGSIFVQISDENVHLVRNILDEVFGQENFVCQIGFRTTMTKPTKTLNNVFDYILWFSRNKDYKFHELFVPRSKDDLDGYKIQDLVASSLQTVYEYEFQGKKYNPKNGWRLPKESLDKLVAAGKVVVSGNNLGYLRPYSDFPFVQLDNIWNKQLSENKKIYVVQTNSEVIQRCMLMVTDPGDLVLDPTCGSGTTAFVAEQWGRRWITCDTSRVAIQLAKQRIMTSNFEYYDFAQEQEGISSGFRYVTVPHITLGSITKGDGKKEETLYDQPIVVKNKVRVAGPFTVEAVPGIRTKPIAGNLPDISDKTNPTNPVSEKLSDYLDNIRTSGIRSYKNEDIKFNNVEIAEGFNEIHAFGNIDQNGTYQKCALVFGPDYAPMEQTQIERAVDEVRKIEKDKPEKIIFCAYAFDPEASKDIDNIKLKDLQILKAQMNTDLLVKDLKKKVNTNKPFWLIGEPDITLTKLSNGKYEVEVLGFDCYDPRTQELSSCGAEKISMWMLDTNYDNKSIFPNQIFFPMQDEKRDWTKLAKALNGSVDEELLEQYTGTKSIPFEVGDTKTIAIKIVDDRGVEMLLVKKI